MPLLWRYLLSSYLKVFVLCVIAFIAILLTMRLDEIAYFAALGPEALNILWFAVQQIPYLLPIAFPIAALISSILLVQSLSKAHELVALRASGFALKDILAPLLIASLFLSGLNFYIVSELSTTSHLNAGIIKTQLRAINPLLLLHNKSLMQMKGLHFETLGSSQTGEYARDIVFFSSSKGNARFNLLVAQQLQSKNANFIGNYVTLLTAKKDQKPEVFENVVIENIQKSTTAIGDFSQLLEKKIHTINNDHLRLSWLLIRLKEAKQNYLVAQENNLNGVEIKQAKHLYYAVMTEIIRRVSVALAVFSFTLMGLAFGINISRNSSTKGLVTVTFLGAFYLMTFFIAKSFDQALIAATLLYLVPHVIIWMASWWSLRKIAHGIES